MKIKKNKLWGVGSGGGVGLRGGGGVQGGCERRIEVFVKFQKKIGGSWGSGWGVRVDVNEELKFGGSGWGLGWM